MFELSSVIVAAEVLSLAAQFPGDAQFVLNRRIEECGSKPFVRVAGDLRVDGALSLDWNAAEWKDRSRCGLFVEGNLDVSGDLTNFDRSDGPAFVVLGSVQARRLVQGGGAWLIGGSVTLAGEMLGFYNDGYAWIGGDVRAAALIDSDHEFAIEGQIHALRLDDSRGLSYFAEEDLLRKEIPAGVDWDRVYARAVRGEAIVHEIPAVPDILDAARGQEADLLRAAIAAGANLEARDDAGKTPLLIAVLGERVEQVRILLDAGANIAAVSDDGSGVAHLLAFSEDAELIALLLARRPPLDRLDGEGRTPMMKAIEYLNPPYVRLLHDAGIALPSPSLSEDGYPYSLRLAEPSHLPTLEALIAFGVDLNWQDQSDIAGGKSLLHEAIWNGNIAVVRALLKGSARTDVRDAEGRTPLHTLVELVAGLPKAGDHEDVVECARLLLCAGADAFAKAADGRDAIDLMLNAPDTKMRRILVKAALASDRLDARRRAVLGGARLE